MKSTSRYILLSFDVEEFDMPLEYRQHISAAEQIATGFKGLEATMQVIDGTPVKGTFFTTAHFAAHYPHRIREIAAKHEIASHTFYHSSFHTEHLLQSRLQLEKISGQRVYGLRMPRMRPVAMQDVTAAGYLYDSSVNPTWLPGRYNNLSLPRTTYYDNQVLRVPASVSARLRIPLFWLSFKNMPYPVFKRLAISALKRDGYVCLYFHPWEFTGLSAYRIPGYAKRWAGEALQERLSRLICDLQKEGEFTSMQQMLQLKNYLQAPLQPQPIAALL
jgi:peptidoglycan/xylan/chitin deacetylase (PgdA/CDA1 family)